MSDSFEVSETCFDASILNVNDKIGAFISFLDPMAYSFWGLRCEIVVAISHQLNVLSKLNKQIELKSIVVGRELINTNYPNLKWTKAD